MGIKDRKHSNSDDSALFRDAVDGATPLNSRPRIQHPQKPPGKTIQREREQERARAAGLHPDTDSAQVQVADDISTFQRGSVSRKRMRELRGGKIPVRDAIDLHGCTRDEAKALLYDFSHECARARFNCVRVVHGKGKRSGPDGPVLKNAVGQWLRNWDIVLAFCPARNDDGGSGATYVLLRND